MTSLMSILFNQGKPLPKAPKERLRELCESRKKKSEMTAGDMVVAALRESSGPCRARDICNATGLSPQVVGYHLDRLFKAGAVSRQAGQRSILWSMTK